MALKSTRQFLDALVVNETVGYKSIALGLAADKARLASVRESLRDRMEASGLLVGSGLAKCVEAEYRAKWRAWCSKC